MGLSRAAWKRRSETRSEKGFARPRKSARRIRNDVRRVNEGRASRIDLCLRGLDAFLRFLQIPAAQFQSSIFAKRRVSADRSPGSVRFVARWQACRALWNGNLAGPALRRKDIAVFFGEPC